MVTRFDHVVIGVRDLEMAQERYRRLGFDVRPGGRHTGLGTHNAIIRFGLDYIELLSIYDEAEARESRLGGRELLDFLHEREGGLLGYALATDEIEQEAERFSDATPFAMQRLRPDGRLLTWNVLIPGGVCWRRPWPFLIRWDVPDEQRLLWEEPGIHPNGAIEWIGATVVVRNLESAVDLYEQQLGLTLKERGGISPISANLTGMTRVGHTGDASGRGQAPSLQRDGGSISRMPYRSGDLASPGAPATRFPFAASQATFQLGRSSIDLLTPIGSGLAQQVLADVGEGLLEVSLAVKDLEQACSFLRRSGIDCETEAAGPGAVLIAPDHALGARLILVTRV